MNEGVLPVCCFDIHSDSKSAAQTKEVLLSAA